ncbi:MAG: aldo/keto reductase [Neisseriaceae bacterium]
MNSSNIPDKIEIDVKSGSFHTGNVTCPMVGFGSDKLLGKVCVDAIVQAAEAGYRIIDSATAYKNLDAIGDALQQLDRKQFYIISKVWHNMLYPEDVNRDLEETLKKLKTDYLDAYLIHWPNRSIPIEKTLLAMEKSRQQNKIHHVGMSNVTVNHLKKALEIGVPISWVQVEMNPNFFDQPLYELCQENSISYQVWRPLDFGRLNNDELLVDIGKKYNKSACQIALKWIVQHGCVPLPGSKNKDHIRDNINIMDFSISADDMKLIDQRAIPGKRFRLREDYGLGFTDEFDLTYDECWANGA